MDAFHNSNMPQDLSKSSRRSIVPLRSFHCFSRLPKEIRVIIWEAALPGLQERVVRVQQEALKITYGEWEDQRQEIKMRRKSSAQMERDMTEGGTEKIPREWCFHDDFERWESRDHGQPQRNSAKTHMLGIKTDTPTPQVLFANREAYSVALKFYQRAFHHLDHPSEGLYFSQQLDVMYLRYRDFFHNTFGVGRYIMADHNSSGHWGTFPDLVQEGWLALADGEFRVENLALLVDNRAMKQMNKETFDTPDGPETYEEFISEILRDFHTVRHLTIIVKDYQSSGKLDMDIPCLIDTIDLHEASRRFGDAYERGLDPAGELGHCEIPMLGYKDMRIDSELLDAYRYEGTHWEMPKIEYKVAVSSGDMEFVEWLYRVCKKL